MSIATLTSKGQITLPKEVRDQLNLKAGDQLRFEAGSDGTLIGRPAARSALQLVGMLKRKNSKPVSVEAMDRGIAGLMRRKHSGRQSTLSKQPGRR